MPIIWEAAIELSAVAPLKASDAMTTEETRAPSTPTTSIDPATDVGVVALTVANLERSLAFYIDTFGLGLIERSGTNAILGAGGTPLLLLTEYPGATPWPHDRYAYTGLYHFAILVPTRADLGRWLRHWLEVTRSLPGQGDHLVSEALYISDPDGNGIEIYRDRPRSEWHWDGGQVRMATDPVDIEGVLDEAAREGQPWPGLPAGTRLGHMHLQVGDIPKASAFYHGILGFDIVAQMPSALFVSAGGYHHHVGMNVWHSRGAGPAPAGTAGLRFFTIDLASEAARAASLARLNASGVSYHQTRDLVLLRDPWQNAIILRVGPTATAADATALTTAYTAV
jgi:catechol 2,3-dioxygenase